MSAFAKGVFPVTTGGIGREHHRTVYYEGNLSPATQPGKAFRTIERLA